MRALILALLVCAGVGGDPPGTVALKLELGKSALIRTGASASMICDDLTIVTPEFAPDGMGFVLRALKPGTTLCGIWMPDQVPGGLYRITVEAPRPPGSSGKQ